MAQHDTTENETVPGSIDDKDFPVIRATRSSGNAFHKIKFGPHGLEPVCGSRPAQKYMVEEYDHLVARSQYRECKRCFGEGTE